MPRIVRPLTLPGLIVILIVIRDIFSTAEAGEQAKAMESNENSFFKDRRDLFMRFHEILISVSRRKSELADSSLTPTGFRDPI